MDQIVNQAAKIHYMFGGQVAFPMLFRASVGGGGKVAAQHSQSPYSMFMNVAGLKMFLPSTPYDMKGLLKTAIRDNNPVISFESSRLMATKGPVPDEEYTIPLGVADVKREGSDVTVVALAWLVHEALAAAEELAKEGISVEIVDPRSLVPLDAETIRNSVRKTGRLVIADEAGPTAGFSAEIAALATEDAADVCPAQGAGEAGLRLAGADPVQPCPRRPRLPEPQPHHRRHPRGARSAPPGSGGIRRTPAMPAPIVVADSITRIGPEARGAVVVNASHGGVYAAYLAAKLGAVAAIFNDAGIGCDRAGIGGLDYLQEFGMPAATVGHETARIGDGADMMASGVITYANALAASLGVAPGQPCRDAAALLQKAQPADRAPPEAIEGAFLLIPDAPPVWALELGVARRAGTQGGNRRYRLAWRAARRQTRDRAQIRRAWRALQRRRDRQGRRRHLTPAGARWARHPGRDGVGGERPHRRRALDLRGRHYQPGQRHRRRARPARGHQRARFCFRAAPRSLQSHRLSRRLPPP